jgi:hypothetical protein
VLEPGSKSSYVLEHQLFYHYYNFSVLGIKSSALHMPGKLFTTELYPQLYYYVLLLLQCFFFMFLFYHFYICSHVYTLLGHLPPSSIFLNLTFFNSIPLHTPLTLFTPLIHRSHSFLSVNHSLSSLLIWIPHFIQHWHKISIFCRNYFLINSTLFQTLLYEFFTVLVL